MGQVWDLALILLGTRSEQFVPGKRGRKAGREL